MSTDERLTDHERRISTMEGIVPGMAADVKEIKELLKEGKGACCTQHAAYIKSQWFHIRALWSVFGGLISTLIAIGICIAGKIKHWF